MSLFGKPLTIGEYVLSFKYNPQMLYRINKRKEYISKFIEAFNETHFKGDVWFLCNKMNASFVKPKSKNYWD